ncbi:MAG: protein translocase subunit SecDF, partial [Cohaesibacteraceae bacterium]|nr:protein translocase subunit SecDF [Cohaesibacteraceae bacterium]
MLHFARWKITLIVATVLVGLTYMTPNFLSKSTLEALPDWMPSNQMVLGLDLQGGAHILLQIEKSGIVDDRLQSIKGEIRSLLREDKIGYTGLKINKNSIQVRIRDTALVDQAVTKLETLEQSVNAGLFAASALREVTIENSGDGIVRAVLTEEGISARVRSAVDQSIE